MNLRFKSMVGNGIPEIHFFRQARTLPDRSAA